MTARPAAAYRAARRNEARQRHALGAWARYRGPGRPKLAPPRLELDRSGAGFLARMKKKLARIGARP